MSVLEAMNIPQHLPLQQGWLLVLGSSPAQPLWTLASAGLPSSQPPLHKQTQSQSQRHAFATWGQQKQAYK